MQESGHEFDLGRFPHPAPIPGPWNVRAQTPTTSRQVPGAEPRKGCNHDCPLPVPPTATPSLRGYLIYRFLFADIYSKEARAASLRLAWTRSDLVLTSIPGAISVVQEAAKLPFAVHLDFHGA